MTTDNLTQWSRFWEQGFITTFGASKPDNYDGVVRDFWFEKFIELPDRARILDIATGNGAIASLAAEVNRDYGKEFFIAATDLADISNTLVGGDGLSQLRAGIQFHSRTSCEAQPFDDATFDFTCSQFGFEYGDTEAALAEMRRVLVPDGRFVAISHHADSALIRAACEELDIYAIALDELDLFGKVGNLFDALGNPGDSRDNLARALRKARPLSEAVNSAMNEFRERYPDHDCARDIVGAVGELARGARQASRSHRLAAVNVASEDFRFARSRLQDMTNAALDRQQVEALRISAELAGFSSVHCLDLYSEDGELAGWQIHAK